MVEIDVEVKKPVLIRFPLDLARRILIMAQAQDRSFHAQVVYLLKQALEQQKPA